MVCLKINNLTLIYILVVSLSLSISKDARNKDEEYNKFKQQLQQNTLVEQYTCKNFIQLMKVYSQYNPPSLLGSAQRFIQCSASQAQSIQGYDCCQNLGDGKFFIINWPNYVHEHDYEYLYVQNLKQGICLPDFCDEEDLNSNINIINDIIANLQLDFFITSGNSDFKLPQVANNSTNTTIQQPKKTNKETNIIFNIDDTERHREIGNNQILLFMSILILILPITLNCLTKFGILKNNRIIEAFDHKKNINQLLVGKIIKGDLNVFNLIRICSISAIFLIHSFQNQDLAKNYHQIVENSHSITILIVYFFFQAVDIFLFMGGFFQAISWFKKDQLDKLQGSFLEIFRGIYQRFLRVWPMFFIIMILYTQIYYNLGSGALWNLQEQELENCDEYMWGNLLFIDNLFSIFTWKCFGHSWYISVDFQLYSICLVLLWFYSKSASKGKLLIQTVLFLSLLYNLYFAIENNIKALDISDLAKFEQFTESTTYYQVGMNFYRKPWARAPLFISGLLFGMSYKNKSYMFSEKNQEKLSYSSLYRSYYAFIIIASALFLIFFPLPILYSPEYYSNLIQSLYFFSMPVLTIIMMVFMVTLLMNIYNKNENGFLNKLCNNRITSILTKISFIMYLVHIFIIRYNTFSQQELSFWTPSVILGQFIVNFFISIWVCVFLHIYYEVPISKLIAKKRTVKQNQKIQPIQNNQIELQELKEIKNAEEYSQKNQIHEYEKQSQQKYEALKQIDTSNNENNKKTKYFKLSYITLILVFLLGFYVYQQLNEVRYSQSNLLADQYYDSLLCKEYNQQQRCLSCYNPFNLQIDGCIYKEYISKNKNSNSPQYDLLLFNKLSKQQQNHYSNNDIKLDSFEKNFIPIYFKQGQNIQRWIIDFSTKDQLNQYEQEYKQQKQINQEEFLPETIISRKGGLFNFVDKENKIFSNYQYVKMIYEENDFLKQFLENLDILVKNKISKYQPRECIIYINSRQILDILTKKIGEIKLYMKQLFQYQSFSLKLIIDLSYKDFQDYKQQTQILEDANIQYFIVLPQIDKQDFQDNCEAENKQQNNDLIPFNLNEYNKMLQYFIDRQQKQIQNLQSVGYSYLNFVYIYKCAFQQGISFLNQDIAFYQQDSILKEILDIWKNQVFIDYDGEILDHNISILNQNIKDLKNIQYESNYICKNLNIYQTRINYQLYQICFSHFDNNFSYQDQEEEELNQFNQFYEFYKYKRPNNKEAYEKKKTQYYQKLVSQDEQFRSINENNNGNEYIEFYYDTLIDDLGAKCLDGTQPQVQYKYGKYKQRWLIYFGDVEQFNDWGDCNFDIQVQNSLNSYQGSAKYQKNQRINKFHQSQMLKDYNMLYMYSCDGSLLQGTQEYPINISGQDIWLRGLNNTLAYLQHAINYLDMADSRQIIIYGNQNGAAAAVSWANYIQEVLNSINPYLEVKLIIDGGFTVDHLSYNSVRNIYREQLTDGFYKFSNKDIYPPNKKCVQFYDQFLEQNWECLFLEQNLQFLNKNIPIFIHQSQYDISLINQILKIKCTGSQIDCFGEIQINQNSEYKTDLQACNNDELKEINKLKVRIINRIQLIKEERQYLSAYIYDTPSNNYQNLLQNKTEIDDQVQQFLEQKDFQFFKIKE